MGVPMQRVSVTTQRPSLLAMLGLCIGVCSNGIGDGRDSPATASMNVTSLGGLTSPSTGYPMADKLTPGVVGVHQTAALIHVKAGSIREPNQTTENHDSLKDRKFPDDMNTNHRHKPGSLLRVVCSFDSTSPSRANKNRFLIQNLSASLCTDLYYDHAVITDETNEIQAISKLDIFPQDGNMYIPSFVTINDFKVKFPGLRTFLTIVESSKLSFGDFTHGSHKLKSFVRSCLKQARIWGFDGINIKWRQLPKLSSLTHILHHLKLTFEEEVTLNKLPKLLLGVSLFGDISQFQDLEEVAHINSLVDQVTLLPFNLVGESATETRLKSPLYPLHNKEANAERLSPPGHMDIASEESTDMNSTQELAERLTKKTRPEMVKEVPHDALTKNTTSEMVTEVPTDILTNKTTPEMVTGDSQEIYTEPTFIDDMTVDTRTVSPRTIRETRRTDISLKEALDALVTHGVSKSKINVAISLTGQSYTLKDADVHGIGAPIVGVGSVHDKVGQVYFTDMCKMETGTTRSASDTDDTPYWYNERLWISYENLRSIRQKIDYVLANHIGGIMLISQSEDDFSGESCSMGPFPVSRMLYNMSNLNFHLSHYYYSFPWAEYCGTGTTAAVGDMLLVSNCFVVSVLVVVSL